MKNAKDKMTEEEKEKLRKQQVFVSQVAIVRNELKSLRGGRTPTVIGGTIESLMDEANRLGLSPDYAKRVILQALVSTGGLVDTGQFP